MSRRKERLPIGLFRSAWGLGFPIGVDTQADRAYLFSPWGSFNQGPRQGLPLQPLEPASNLPTAVANTPE